MRPAILFCLLLSAATAQARLDETVKEIEVRYGKPLKGVIPESPATVAGVYEKNGFRIIVGFYQDKDCYEKLQKIDPKKTNSFQDINEEERVALLKANCKSCDWIEKPRVKDKTKDTQNKSGIFLSFIEVTHYTYDRSEGNATATYDDHSMVLVIRSLTAEKQKEADYISKDELIKRVAELTGKSEKVVGFAYSVLKSPKHRSNKNRSAELTEGDKVKLILIRKNH